MSRRVWALEIVRLKTVTEYPTQHSVWGLRGLGLIHDILACRSTKAHEENVKEKLAQFCHVPLEYIFTLYDVPNIWHIPLLLKAHLVLSKVLNLTSIVKEPSLEKWTSRAELCDNLHVPVRIAVVEKYIGLSDAYLSVLKALLHAYVACRKKLVVDWVPACDLENQTEKENPNAYEAAWKLLKVCCAFWYGLVINILTAIISLFSRERIMFALISGGVFLACNAVSALGKLISFLPQFTVQFVLVLCFNKDLLAMEGIK